MRTVVIRVPGGEYVRSYDPHAYGGRGLVETTPFLHRAVRFATVGDACAFIRQSAGTRPDGKPSRPLTALDLEVLRIDELLAELPAKRRQIVRPEETTQ